MKLSQFFKHLIFCLLLINLHLIGAQTTNDIEWTDCFLTDCSGLEKFPNVKFGYLTIPENYDEPNERPLKIAFAIVKSEVENPKPDPILIFQGGWGATMLNNTLYYTRNYAIKDRDIILFDYRGSGYSEPELCDWIGEKAWEDIKGNLQNETFENNQTRRFNQCLDSLEIRGIDYNQYGSNTKTKDAVKLAEALGYKAYNLSGISYGTRAILNFIRNAKSSDIVIRSIIMDSNSPIGGVIHHGTAIYSYTDVLNNILKDCEDNPDCAKTFPNLKNRFVEYLISLDNDPWVVPLEDGSTFTVNREELNAYVHQLLYSHSLHQYLPLVLERFINRDNLLFNLMVTQIEAKAKSNFNGLGAINFVYDHKYFRDTTLVMYNQLLTENPPFKIMDAYIDFFLKDRRIATDSLEHIQVKSDIPALFLAGSYDPITPPSWTQYTASGFANNFYFEAPRFGHGISTTKCGESLLRQFIDNPNKRPDNSCLENLGENQTSFRAAYYKNSKVALFLKKISEFNLRLVAVLLFFVIVSIINLVLYVKSLFKKTAIRKPNFNLTSVLIVAFMVGFTLFLLSTISDEPFLILFGLVEQANYIFYLSIIIIIVGLFQLFNWLRNSEKTKWDYVSVISLLLFIVFVVNYNLFPNF